MKRISIIALVLFTFATTITVNAQTAKNQKTLQHVQPDDDDDPIEKFKDQLKLTTEQQAKIKDIKQKRAAEKKELMAKLKAIRNAEREEINAILTDEQRALIKEKKAAKQTDAKEKGKGSKNK
jgi:Spy/CpxP family protein refolding chaperone